MKKLVIIGATGKVGSQVSNLLLEKGYQPTLIARNAERLELFRQRGARVIATSVTDVEKLTEALRGADAILTMIASNGAAPDFLLDQRLQANALFEAIKRSGVPYVVNLSSAGCHVTEGNGVIQGLAEFEVLLRQLPNVNVLNLRPSFYMENTFYALPLIKHQGIYGLPIRPTTSFPMVATQDVAQVIVEKVAALDFTGNTVLPILGAKDYALAEITTLLGAAIGKELPYVPFSLPDFTAGIRASGGSADYAARFGELMVASDHGLLNYERRTPETTTPTTFADFAQQVFAPAYNPL